ncbi:MAG: metallophosphoesterase, partial [Hyphomicrobiaceae bacterium]|nr:metallophosphoesterase [Hyphomicrobiaceae bacterium]
MDITLLEQQNKTIGKIVHISDIHIYLPIDNNRKKEYDIILNNLYGQISKLINENNNLLICITGDLCHKNKLYGKEINYVELFLAKLCSYAPVVMSPGNHDYNSYESEKMTYIEPIMRNKKTTNPFYLLSENGLYRYNNLIFGLTSVYSKCVVKCDVHVDKNIKKIGLYHGHVHSKKISKIVPDKDCYFKLNEFESYDMCLFGDIHQPSSLDDAQSRWYAGSLIQQQGEQLDHGYVLWDVEKSRGEFIKLKNEYGYVTFEIDEDGYNKISTEDYPKYAKVQCMYKNIDYTRAKKYAEDIKKKYGVYVEPQMDFTVKNTQNNNTINNNINDIQTKEGLYDFIVKYISERENIDEMKKIDYFIKKIMN